MSTPLSLSFYPCISPCDFCFHVFGYLFAHATRIFHIRACVHTCVLGLIHAHSFMHVFIFQSYRHRWMVRQLYSKKSTLVSRQAESHLQSHTALHIDRICSDTDSMKVVHCSSQLLCNYLEHLVSFREVTSIPLQQLLHLLALQEPPRTRVHFQRSDMDVAKEVNCCCELNFSECMVCLHI